MIAPARLLPALALFAALPALPGIAATQAVQGQVLDAAAGRTVPGVLVVLVDGGGHARASALTDGAGRFTVAAPAAGTYRLRAERVGRASTTSAPLALAAGETRQITLHERGAPVVLAAVAVEREAKACGQVSATMETAALWEEARKALASADWTEDGAALRFDVARHARSLDPATMQVRSEERQTQRGPAVHPFASLPPDSLSRLGYVVSGKKGTLYYGPDARVLSSPQFVDEHCFHVVPTHPTDAALVGLGFEPVRNRDLPEIRGVMWLDRATAELRSVEYHYANLATRVAADSLGGRVEFERMPNGAWIVRRWRIRTPELAITRRVDAMATDRAVAGAVVESLIGIHEDGGEVTDVRTRAGAKLGALALATIQGTLRDGGTGEPVAGARVFVSGTQYAAVTDSAGRFRMDGVDEGSYAISFVHPRLDSLNLAPPVAAVSVRPGDAAEVALQLPAAAVRVAVAARAVADAQGSGGRPIPLERVSATAQGRGRSEFYQRAGHGQGSYVTREQIERMHGARTADLFRGIPSLEVVGTSLRVRSSGNQAPRGPSYAAAPPPGSPGASGAGGQLGMPQPTEPAGNCGDAACEERTAFNVPADCQPALWVDGQPAPGGVRDLSALAPTDIEGIEVYARAATAPGQYKRLNSDCAIILIWTRNESGSTVQR